MEKYQLGKITGLQSCNKGFVQLDLFRDLV